MNELLHASDTGSSIVDRFSLVEGGPIYRFQRAVHMAMPDRSGVLKRALATTLITWFPLLIFSLLQGRAFDNHVRMPFLYDFAAAVRFLIGLPLLVIAEAVIDPRLAHAVKHLVNSRIIAPENVSALERVILKVNKLRDSVVPSILILLASFLPSIWYKQTEALVRGASTWHTIPSSSGDILTLAGWWFGVISVPLFRVLLFRWLWMLLLWAFFLRGLRGINLGCIATHPDARGGLGFLTHAQLLFGFIAFAGSAVLAGQFGNAIAYQGASVSSLKFLIITACVLTIVVFAAPLLIVTPKLALVKRRGIYEYGALGTAYTQAFDAKWIERASTDHEPLLGTSDIQSLADLRNSFSVVQDMKVVLIDKEVILGLAIPTILPMLPLIILATPADELMRAVLKLLV